MADLGSCSDRSATKEFTFDELRLIQTDLGDAIRIEAFEIARTKARR